MPASLSLDTVIVALAGALTAAAIVGAARATDFASDRSFYPTVLVVIALLYVLFGVEAGGAGVLVVETAVALAFVAAAVMAHRRGWTALLAAGLALHGAWDVAHGAALPASDAVPPWWPAFCLGVDLALAAYVLARWPPGPSRDA